MGAGKLWVLAGRRGTGVGAAVVVAALATACGSVSYSSSTQRPAVPTVTPSSVPVLGKLTLSTFPATEDGRRALTLCEQWSGLRGEYVSRVQADTGFELEQWFSSRVWLPAFSANSPLRTDPAYGGISTSFGLVSTGEAASISSARMLDAACAAVD
jgi:hypothetical protein